VGPRRGSGTAGGNTIYGMRLVFAHPSLPNPVPTQDCRFALVEEGGGDVAQGSALNEIGNNLRLFIEDNIMVPSPLEDWRRRSKGQLITDQNLASFLRAFVPITLEVFKFRRSGGSWQRGPLGQGEAFAVWEVEDPSGDFAVIRQGGLRSDSDQARPLSFMEEFMFPAGIGADNCPRHFCPDPFMDGCRRPDGLLHASDALLEYRDSVGADRPPGLPPDPSDTGERARIGVPAGNPGLLNVLFNPPPIGGDNYQIKVKLVDSNGHERQMRRVDQSGNPVEDEVNELSTPMITIWRRVKIENVIRQQGIPDVTNWQQIRRLFRAAYIELHPDPVPAVNFTRDEWINYLRQIYQRWHTEEFNNLLGNAQVFDFDKFILPQDSRLVLPDNPPGGDFNHTASFLFESLRDIILRDKIPNFQADHGSPRFGLCVLVVRTRTGPGSPMYDNAWHRVSPIQEENRYGYSEGSGGAYSGDKRMSLFIEHDAVMQARRSLPNTRLAPSQRNQLRGGDITMYFSHEVGHALFLRHGLTDFNVVDGSDKLRARTDVPFVVNQEGGGMDGPFYDDHDPCDSTSCIMSYYNEFFERPGRPLPANIRVDYHFCGMCLLLLRFYDRVKLASYSPVQRLLSSFIITGSDTRAPGSITLHDGDNRFRQLTGRLADGRAAPGRLTLYIHADWRNLDLELRTRGGRRTRLITAFAPHEGVRNNINLSNLPGPPNNPYFNPSEPFFRKDIGNRPRVEWHSDNPAVAEMVHASLGNGPNRVFTGMLMCPNPPQRGQAVITFRLIYGTGPNDFHESDPLTVIIQ